MLAAYIGELAALGTATCWTFTALAFESAGHRIGSMVVNFLRLPLALIPLSLYGFLVRGHALPTDADGHQWLWLSLSALAGLNFGDLCLFRAFVLVGSRLSVLMMSLVPPMTALLSYFINGEALTPLDLLGMALTLTGIVWVTRERTPTRPGGPLASPSRIGLWLAFGGAVGQALGLVLAKYGMGDFDPFAATQIRVFVGAVAYAAIFSVVRWWGRVGSALQDRRALSLTGMGAFFGPFLGISFSLLAVQRTEAGVAATIMAMTPVIILPFSRWVRHEHISLRAVLGSIVAVAGVAVLFLAA